tara:strand:- start:71619 stop:73028 length:1410 start_codon:yes stop_codon:yes gene_type:complete
MNLGADMDDIAFLGLVEVGRKIQTGEVTSVDVTSHILERIERLDRRYNSYATVISEMAISAAKTADTEIQSGKIRGPLHGVPIAVKDLCDTKGILTACGMPMFQDRIPTEDSTVVSRLREAGAILLGKLQMTEGALAMHHPDIVVPVNPWVNDRWSGASSSGSGVSVAAGLTYGSLGSDTGGSIRFPSLCNGIVGLKGTWGRVSRSGIFPLSDTLDHVGPMARKVEDVAAILSVIAGHDASDPTSLTAKVPDYLSEIDKGVEGLRVGFDESYCSNGVNSIISDAVHSALDSLSKAGAKIVEFSMPNTDDAVRGWVPLCVAEAVVAHSNTFPSRADEYSDTLRGFLEAGEQISGPEYAQATIHRKELCGAMQKIHQDVDLIMTLTLPDPIPTVAEFAKIGESADAVERLIKYTSIADLTGNPTISLPAGFDGNGAPIGIQFMGSPLSESLLCRAGYIFQTARDWSDSKPN